MSDTETLLPLYHNKDNSKMIFKNDRFCSVEISFTKFGWTSSMFSFFSFFFCVFWSIAYNFEEANATHCAVENYLPSISAAIGHYYPQIYVWILMIVVQMYPRLKISTMYFHYFSSIIYDKYYKLYYLAWVFSVLEIWALLGLSLITSSIHHSIHACFFSLFLLMSLLFMIVSCYLLKFKRKIPAGDLELKMLKWKFKCCFINIFCLLMAGYFYKRHNDYCEPGVYTLFAFFEYGVVITNMLFHNSAIWDFHDKILTVTLTSQGIETDYSPPFKSAQYNLK